MGLRSTFGWAAVFLGVLAGCDDGGGGDGGGVGGGDGGADAGPVLDGNDGFDEAQPLTLGEESDEDVIATPGDVDYYSFTGTAGQWVMISARATSAVEPRIRPHLTLLDSSMTVIAAPDLGNVTTLALPTRLPAEGTYYVSLQDRTSGVGGTPEAGPTFTYRVLVEEIPASADGYTRDVEDNDVVGQAQTVDFAAPPAPERSIITGTAIDASDVDVFSFDVSASGPQQVVVSLYPAGLAGNGSTGTPNSLWITNAAGTEIVARIATTERLSFIPVLDPANYKLWVDHPAVAGTNDFYFLVLDHDETLPLAEANEAGNGTIAGAEPLGSTLTFAGKLGNADVDHVSVAATNGQTVYVECRSRVDGSGVIGLDAALFASTDTTGTTELAGGTESDTDAIAFEYAVPSAGTYVLRLSKSSQDAQVVGTAYFCSFRVQ